MKSATVSRAGVQPLLLIEQGCAATALHAAPRHALHALWRAPSVESLVQAAWGLVELIASDCSAARKCGSLVEARVGHDD
jgi:hypothetical protein